MLGRTSHGHLAMGTGASRQPSSRAGGVLFFCFFNALDLCLACPQHALAALCQGLSYSLSSCLASIFRERLRHANNATWFFSYIVCLNRLWLLFFLFFFALLVFPS